MDSKPDDQICCVETNIEMDFEAPKDYVEPPKIQKQTSTQKRAIEEEKDAERMKELESKYTRIDGKQLTQKQKRELLAKMKADEKAENPDFDPR